MAANKNPHKRTSQEMDNMSFDDTFNQNTQLLVGYDGTNLQRVKVNSDGELETHDPTAPYKISNIDSSAPAYYGYIDKNGGWYIMKESSDVYTYAKGSSGYNWANRPSESYDTFDNTF